MRLAGQPLKVVHVVTAFPRHEGDMITPWLTELLRAQRARGIDASVLSPAYRGGGATEYLGIPVVRFRYAPRRLETLTHDETAPDRLRSRPWMAGLLPGFVVGGLFAAWRVARSRPDVVHVHWPAPNAIFGAAVRLLTGGRCVVVSSYYSAELRWIGQRLRPLVPFLRWTMRSADVTTANSSATAEVVRSFGGEAVRVVPSPAGLVKEGSENRNARRSPGAFSRGGAPDSTDRCPQVLFVGRLVERKGVEVLVRAVASLARRRSVRLLVVGEGEWRDRIANTVDRERAGKVVRLAGRVSDEELDRAYGESDVFVLPAVFDSKGDTEGLGVVLIEALLRGLPVIGSRIGGIPDIVVDGEGGWLVPPGKPEALEEALDQVLGDSGEAERRAKWGKRHVETGFSASVIAATLEECYRNACGK